jgi:hypothetical protein
MGLPTQFSGGAPNTASTEGDTQATSPSRTWTTTSDTFSASSRYRSAEASIVRLASMRSVTSLQVRLNRSGPARTPRMS